MKHEEANQLSRSATIVLMATVGLLSFGVGLLVTHFMAAGQSGWFGLALVPLWLLVEAALGFLFVLGSIPGKPDKLPVIVVVLAGFYGGVLLLPVLAA